MAVLERPLVRDVERSMLVQQAEDVAPLVGRHRAVANHVANEAVRLGAAAPQQLDHRQRDLALAQIAADGLAQRSGVGGVVEQIVDELERDARD